MHRLESQVSRLIGEDGAVADLVFLDAGDGFVGLLHGEALGDGLNVVSGGYVEHLVEVPGAAGGAAGDGFLACEEAEGRDLQGRGAGTEENEGALGAEGVD